MIIDPHSISRLGAALGSPARVAMCLALLDGRAWTAGELARAAGVTRSTASEHLTTLLDTELVTVQKQGRHSYVRLASAEAAHLIEVATSYAGTPARVSSLRAASVREDMAAARTCYDHLAGTLGVALFDALIRGGQLSEDLELTAAGRALFTEIAGPAALQRSTRRPLVKTCLDWTERRSHLSGHLGAVLLQASRDHQWIAPRSTSRAVSLTASGLTAFRTIFGIPAEALRPSR